MKKILVLVFVLFLTKNITAQKYVPFPDSNAFWEVAYYNDIYCPPPSGYCRTLQYYFKDDTIINSVFYHKLYRKNLFNYSGIDYYGGIRQDTLEKKVFFKPDDNGNQEHLLYDFNLDIGDTLPLTYFNSTKCYVVDIDTVYVGGVLRKKFLLNSDPAYYCSNCYLLEGIGGSSGIVEPFGYFEGGSFLVCFKQNDTTYFSPFGNCHIVDNLSIKKLFTEIIKIKIYPNPATNFVRISTENGESIKTDGLNIIIIDAYGRQIKKIENYKKEIGEFNISVLKSGIYFIEIYNDNKKIFYDKLIKI
jgi:hypothetical protein